jgi:hypothetical protein
MGPEGGRHRIMDLSAWKHKPVANDIDAMPFLDPTAAIENDSDHDDTASMSGEALEQLVLDFLRALRDD